MPKARTLSAKLHTAQSDVKNVAQITRNTICSPFITEIFVQCKSTLLICMLPFLQVTSPILQDHDFDPLVHVGKVRVTFLDSHGGEKSSVSYAYKKEPELSRTIRFTSALKKKN